MKSDRIAALCALLSLATCGVALARGQSAGDARASAQHIALPVEESPAAQIAAPIDPTRLVVLRGNTHPQARPEYDRGPVDPQMPLERMLLVLKRSPGREAALEAFMERQQDPESPDYHHWLEPEELGTLYGPSEADIAAVSNWLRNEGFTVEDVSKGRTFIHFSGTAGLVQRTFHTEMHHYTVNGEEHISNNADPSIPEALTPVVVGIFSLNDFFAKPQHIDLGSFRRDSKTGKWMPLDPEAQMKPMFNVPAPDNGFELVTPFDFATIYNVLPLWNASPAIDGTGVTIAIAGRSDISLTDVAKFRSSFGLPAKAPVIITNGADPGVPTADDKVENTLDVEWSGAVAKGATIKFVTTKSTSTTDGAVESVLYIINNKTAPIMSFSYGNCELAYGTAGNSALNMMWQSGAAEEISEFVASGDQGAAACDGGHAAPYEAEFGEAVSGASSTPYNVSVGGTDLNWANSTTTYWSATNATDGESALGYIPEVPWNGTCASVDVDTLIGGIGMGWDEETTCEQILAQQVDEFLLNVTGGTGGKSACTTPSSTTVASCSGGYAKPTWQTGIGVPADTKRDVPDVSLFASSGALNTAYAICNSAGGPCTYSVGADALAQAVGGTSVASPAMAGIMALILQHAGGAAQGLPNKVFYQLAAKDTLSKCNSKTVASGNACNFFDITSDNNAVPCAKGSPNCTIHDSGDTIGILNGYTATTGYDLATGLGSVNAKNLVTNFAPAPAGITLTPSTLAFLATPLGTTSEAQSIVVKNTGAAAFTLNSITLAGTNPTSFVELNTCGTSLAGGASCTVFVAFKPASAGALKATLSVSDTAPGTPQIATLTGTGVAKPSVTLSKASLTFASTAKGTTSAAQSVTVTNKGTTTLDITGIALTGTDPTSFLELNTCGPTLTPAAVCTIDVAFKPAATGALTAKLVITDNGSTATQSVTLTGTGH
jgi:subtilase family serine protease